MFFRNNILVVLISLSLLSLQAQCNKRLGCAEKVYNFSLGIKAYPNQDSLNVGDTIWLEIIQAVNLNNLQTGEIVNYSNAANLGTAISFAKLISFDSTNDKVASDFRYLLVSGNEIRRSDTNKYREYKFAELNGYYQFKLALITTQKGVYKMFISNAANVFRYNDKCTKANFEINFIETDQHFYFNEVSFPGIILSGKNGVYLFKVK